MQRVTKNLKKSQSFSLKECPRLAIINLVLEKNYGIESTCMV